MKKQPPKGMRDFLPETVTLRNELIEKISKSFSSFGFDNIITPEVEHIENLESNNGGDNEKMIFKILKRGEKLSLTNGDIADYGLRYDLTLPLTRYYINNHSNLEFPFKSLQIGNVWRAERPQKNRYRSFTQCDIDIIGDEEITAELSLLIAAKDALSSIGIQNIRFVINDRQILNYITEYFGLSKVESEQFFISLDKVDKIGWEEVYKELINKNLEKENIENLLNLIKELMGKNFRELRSYSELGNLNLPLDNIENIFTAYNNLFKSEDLIFDLTLVRGMNYYTGTIFEIKYGELEHSIGGGGRYNNLITINSKDYLPACGVSLGFERILNVIENINYSHRRQKKLIIIYRNKSIENYYEILGKNIKFRDEFDVVTSSRASKNIKNQLNRYIEKGFTHFCIAENNFEIKELE